MSRNKSLDENVANSMQTKKLAVCIQPVIVKYMYKYYVYTAFLRCYQTNNFTHLVLVYHVNIYVKKRGEKLGYVV